MPNGNKTSKSSRPSIDQKRAMIKFMEEKPAFARGEVDSDVVVNTYWDTLTELLNHVGPAQKVKEEWQSVSVYIFLKILLYIILHFLYNFTINIL